MAAPDSAEFLREFLMLDTVPDGATMELAVISRTSNDESKNATT